VTIVAVFLAYKRPTTALPFVPTYNVEGPSCPNAANLVKGATTFASAVERVGSVSDIVPVHHANGLDTAVISMKLEKRVDPLSDGLDRDRAAPLGPSALKYVQITPGSAGGGYGGRLDDPAVAGASRGPWRSTKC